MKMKTPEYFDRTWTFFEVMSGQPLSVREAYPSGATVTIKKQSDGRFNMAWHDNQRQQHLLSDLQYENGFLTGKGIKDPGTGLAWRIRIEVLMTPLGDANERDRIQGTVQYDGPGTEGNLTGTWGAESPPKPDPDHPGKPS
jgi:hypothetical protein